MLDAPAVPIEMKVFQGGGDTSLLEQPHNPIELKVYQGGVVETRAQTAKREAEETAKALAKAPNSTPTISPEVDSELDAALGTPQEVEAEAEAANAPEQVQEAEAEAVKAPKEVQEAPKEVQEAEAEAPKAPKILDLYDDVETVKLSNGIRVRSIPDDPEKEKLLKRDIQFLLFTNEEEMLFRDYLKFDHPFIRGYLTSPEMKEDFYKFWKTYITYDGTDNFLLLTYNEGKFIQNFMKDVLRAYREYLMTTSLAYLMKQEESDYKKPQAGDLGYELFDIQYGEPKMARSSDEIAAEIKQIAIDDAIEESENKEAEHADELVDIRRVEKAEKAEGLVGSEAGLTQEISNDHTAEIPEVAQIPVPKEQKEQKEPTPPKNQELRDTISNILSNKSLTPEKRIIQVIKELDDEIPNKQRYQQKIMNSPLITISSLTKKKIPPTEIIKYDFVKNPSITEFLRTLLKTDVSSTKFKKEDRTLFVIFFSKIVTNEAAARLSSYFAASLDKTRKKVNFRGGSNETSSRIQVRTSRKVRSK